MPDKTFTKSLRIIALALALALCVSILPFSAEQASADRFLPPTDKDDRIRDIIWIVFADWAEQYWENMLNFCPGEWKQNTENPQEQLEAFLGDRHPQEYLLEGISGKDGDPVRTATCVARVIEGAGNEPRAERLEFRLILEENGFYRFNPIVDPVYVDSLPEGKYISLDPESNLYRESVRHSGWPAEDLTLLNRVCENGGLRFEVISGSANKNGSCFICSLQDPEEKYNEFNFKPSFAQTICTPNDVTVFDLYKDEERHKQYYAFFVEFNNPEQKSDRTVSLGLSHAVIQQQYTIDLLPLLEQYGKTSEGVALPETVLPPVSWFQELPAGMKALDYTRPLNIPVVDNVFLTGIGWIDNQLHVQFHTTLPDAVKKGDGEYPSWEVDVNNEAPWTKQPSFFWDEDGNGWPEWAEFVFNGDTDPEDDPELTAVVSILRDVPECTWKVEFPLGDIWKEY